MIPNLGGEGEIRTIRRGALTGLLTQSANLNRKILVELVVLVIEKEKKKNQSSFSLSKYRVPT